MNLPKRSSPEQNLALLSAARSALTGGGKVYKNALPNSPARQRRTRGRPY